MHIKIEKANNSMLRSAFKALSNIKDLNFQNDCNAKIFFLAKFQHVIISNCPSFRKVCFCILTYAGRKRSVTIQMPIAKIS